MRILKHPILQLIFLSLSPLVMTLLQATQLEFPTTSLQGASYNPWPRLIFNALLICVAQGLIFWLLLRAGDSAWLNRRSLYARLGLRLLFTAIGLVVLVALMFLSVAQVFSAWSSAQLVNSLDPLTPPPDPAAQQGSGLAAVEMTVVGVVWIALFAEWYISTTMAAERKRPRAEE